MNVLFTIRTRLTAVFVCFAVLLMLALGLLAYIGGRHYLYQAAVSELLALAIEKQAGLDQWTQEREAQLAVLAESENLRDDVVALRTASPGSPQAQRGHQELIRELNAWVGTGKTYLELMVMEPELGEVIASTDPAEEGSVKEEQAYFIHGRHSSYTQNLYYSIAEQGPAMTVATPLYSADGQLLAVLAGRLDLGKIAEIVSRRTGLRQSDDAFLVTSDQLLATPPRFWPDALILQQAINTEAVVRCLTRNSGVVALPDYRQIPTISVYRWLPERQMCLIVKMDQAEAYRPARLFGQYLMAIGLAALLAGAFVAAGLANAIVRPLQELQAGVSHFSAGKWTTPLPETRLDELGLLTQEFNQMAATLLQKEAELREHARTLEEKVEQRTAALHEHAQELARSNTELEQFAYVASHDLQEPLRMVVSYMKLLERRYKGQLDDDADEFIYFAVDGALRMQRLISDLLAYSRVGAHRAAMKPTQVEAVLAQAVANLQPVIHEANALVSNDPLPTVIADGLQLVHLLQNLMGNAIKFHSTAVPCVHISAEREGDMWRFAVTDNGIGIEAQYADRIFVIFQRLHSKEEYAGTGIGLAICKKIVERHNGRIWFESELGHGTTFYFTLPAAIEEVGRGT